MSLAPWWARPRRVALTLAALPLGVLVAMYAWLAIAHRALNLFPVIVHESGRYTLLQTIFYVSHFLREIPVDVVIALSAASAALSLWSPAPRSAADRLRLAALCGGLALVVAAASFAAAAVADGAASARLDLLQYRTRDDESAPGSHWNYHLLSSLWFLLGALPVLRLTMATLGLGASAPAARVRARVVSWGYALLLSLAFGVSSLAWTSGRYAGHQARELLTHVPVTLLLTAAALIAVVGPAAFERDGRSLGTRLAAAVRRDLASWIAILAIAVFLAIRTLGGGGLEEGQSGQGVAGMVAAHFFEHVLDYVFTPAVAVTAALLLTGSRLARSQKGGNA